MISEKKNYTVEIFGSKYSLRSDESEQHIADAAHLIDTFMQEIAQHSQDMKDDKIAVLAALRIASMLLKSNDDIAVINNEHTRISQEIDRVLHATDTNTVESSVV